MALGNQSLEVRSQVGKAGGTGIRAGLEDTAWRIASRARRLAGYSLPQMEWGGVVRLLIEWTRTGRGMAAMAVVNIVSIIALGAYYWEQRSDRLEAEAELAAWMTADIYAPTELRVHIGPTMASTYVIEEPVFDGGRVLADFPGRWSTRLKHVETNSLVCTMPALGPRDAPYTHDAPRIFDTDWADYTGDDGRCFGKMRAGEQYDLTTVREAFKIIDGKVYQRFLNPVQSPPFTFPAMP